MAPIVIRWMRLFILAVLLPAYAYAAVHVEPYVANLPSPEAAALGGHEDSQPRSLSQLSDTTDDVCDHCIAYAFEVTAVRVRQWDRPIELPQSPDAVLRQLLRPPSAA